jgi:predicted PurR-regulated permease PerM
MSFLKEYLTKCAEKAQNCFHTIINTVATSVLGGVLTYYLPELMTYLTSLPPQALPLALALMGAVVIIGVTILLTSAIETLIEKLKKSTKEDEREKLKQEILKELKDEIARNAEAQHRRDDKISELRASQTDSVIVNSVRNVVRLSEIATQTNDQPVEIVQSTEAQVAFPKQA